jgi:adenylate cyclase class IV
VTFLREIERKYVILDDVSMYTAHHWLRTFFQGNRIDAGISSDQFWVAPNVDFIRLRANTKELTVKITDKGTIEDRVEENLPVRDLGDAERWATAVFGAPVGTVEKVYQIYYAQHAIVSLYEVTGHPELFLEIEADNLDAVKAIEADLSQQFTLRQEFRSLFNIIFGDV